MLFSLFSGIGLGKFNGSRHLINDGTAGAQLQDVSKDISVNVASGNLTISSTDLVFPAPGLNTVLTRTYNSQDKRGWRVAAVDSILPPLEDYKSLDYQHADGHISTFQWDPEYQAYLAWWPEVGRVSITGTLQTGWKLSVLPTGVTQTFDTIGLLRQQTTWDNGQLDYDYDGQQRLISVKDSANGKLELNHIDSDSGQTIQAIYQGKIWASYYFDSLQRLITVTRPINEQENYSTVFTYQGATHNLHSIYQDDGTELNFQYVLEGNVLKVVRLGQDLQHQWEIHYSPNHTTITAPEGEYQKWFYNVETLYLRTHESWTRDSKRIYSTAYQQNPHGFLTRLTEHTGVNTQFDYHPEMGWRQHTSTYSPDNLPLFTASVEHNEVGRVISSTEQSAQKARSVISIYDEVEKHKLRFIIDANGYVTEKDYNGKNQCIFTYTFFTEPYTGKPTLAELIAWRNSVPDTQIGVEELAYHDNGEVKQRKFYRADNANINSQWDYAVNIFGSITQKQEPNLPDGTRPTHQTEYDGIQRVTRAVNPAQRETKIAYQSATFTTPYIQTTTLPTLAKETTHFTPAGQQSVEFITAIDINRNQFTAHNLNDQIISNTDHLGRTTTTLYDELGRFHGTVDALGYAMFSYRDHRNRETYRHYAESPIVKNPQDLATLTKAEWDIKLAIARSSRNEDDAQGWTVYDDRDRPLYKINGTGAVTEFRYGLLSAPEFIIRFVNRIDVNQLSTQPTVADIQRQLVPHIDDHFTRQWLDNDGRKIAQLVKLNATEYRLIEWKHYQNGLIVKQTEYADKIKTADPEKATLESLRPTIANPEDITSYTYYNMKREVIGTVNGEGILTEQKRDNRGDAVKIIRYYNRVTNTDPPKTLEALRPAADTEDWHTHQEFDGMHRVTERLHPNGRLEKFEYQDSDTPIEHTEEDIPVNGETRNKHARGESRKVNALEETTIQLLPDGVDYRYQGGGEDQAWKVYGENYRLDAAGREAVSEVRIAQDPNNTNTHREVNYFDARNKVRFHVGAIGEITEKTFDNRGNVLTECEYATRVPEEKFKTLQGGKLELEEQHYFEGLRDPAQDRLTQHYYKANRRIATQHPNGQWVLYDYDAFGHQTHVAEQLTSTDWRITIKQFDARDVEIDKKQIGVRLKTTDAKFTVLREKLFDPKKADYEIIAERKVVHVTPDTFGRPAETEDGNDVKTKSTHDKAHRLLEKTCQEQLVVGYSYDAHDRVTVDRSDTQGYRVHDFDTKNRVHYITPVQAHEDGGFTAFHHTKLGLDAFDQTVSEQQGDNKRLLEYEAYGHNLWTQAANGETTTHSYLVGGIYWGTLLPSGYFQHHLLDAAYRDYHMAEYPTDGTTYEMHDYTHTLNTFGDVLHTRESERSGTLPPDRLLIRENKHEYDKRGQRIDTIADPNGAQRQDIVQRRLDGAITQEGISDAHDTLAREATRTQAYAVDSFGRQNNVIVDPLPADPAQRIRQVEDYLQLKTAHAYDAGDAPIATTDANGFTSYAINAGHGRAKLTVDPQGRGVYKEYNGGDKLILERRFDHQFTLDEINSIRTQSYQENIATVLMAFHNNERDLVKQWLYDKRDVLRYEISAGGKVIEHRYNTGAQKIRTIRYTNRIKVDRATPFTLSTIVTTIVPDSLKDESTCFVVNAKGLAEYEIDAEGYLTYQKHDTNGNVQEKTRYAQKLPEGIDFTTVTLDQSKLYAAEREGNPKNRTDINFYSVKTDDQKENLLRFVVDSLGYVTEYQYDIHNNPIREISYHEQGNITEFRQFTFVQLAKWCEAQYQDPSKHKTVDETKFDALNRKTAVINAEGKTDTYKNDILGNPEERTDKRGYIWKNKFDRAGRKIQSSQPLRDVTHATLNKSTKKIESKRIKAEAVTELTPDKLGQIVKTTEGVGLPDERSFTHEFNGSREQHTDTAHDILVYQADKDTNPQAGNDRETFEEIQDLKDQTIFNQFGWPTVVIHRDGKRSYKVFGDDHNEITGEPEELFTIDTDGAVIGNIYDAFGNITAFTKYYTRITEEDLAKYPQGLTLADMLGDDQKEGLLKTHEDDRTIKKAFDRLQRQTAEIFPETIFFNAGNEKTPENDKRFYKLAVRKELEYGAYPEPLKEIKVTNPENAPSEVHHYYDNDGRLLATINTLGYLTEYAYNRNNQRTYQIEHANPCAKTQYDVNGYTPPAWSANNRETWYAYDNLDRPIITLETNVRYRKQYFNADFTQPPVLGNEIEGWRFTSIFYDTQGNPVITVKYMVDPATGEPDEILSLDIALYSPINKVFANIRNPRVFYEAGTHLQRKHIPVIGYEHDSHGRTTEDRMYAQSLDRDTYDQFCAQIFASLENAPYDLAQRDALIQQAYALATPEILDTMKEDTRDRVTVRQYDNANNATAELGPSGLLQYSSFTAVPEQVAKRWWFDKVWDTNLRDRLQDPTLKDQPWVILVNYNATGLRLRLERWAGVEHHIERYNYNAFRERTKRGGEDENGDAQWQEVWVHDPLGQIKKTNAGDGIWKYTLYQPGVQEPSLMITSPTFDLSTNRANDIRLVMNQPDDKRREIQTLFDSEGRPIHRQYPAYSIAKPAPNIALTAGKQTGALASEFGEYAVVWNRPANFGTRAKLFIRVYQPEDNTSSIHTLTPGSIIPAQSLTQPLKNNELEWQELPVKVTATHMGADITQITADYYEYKVELYHFDDPEPYASGGKFISLPTPNTEKSVHLVPTVDTSISSTTIRLTGNTDDPKTGKLTGVRLYDSKKLGEEEKPNFIGVTPDEQHPGQYLVEGRGLRRGVYTGFGRADITNPIGDRYRPGPPPIADSEGKIAEDSSFITEVTAHTTLQVDIIQTEEMWTPKPDDPAYPPCYDPKEDPPHTNHEERGCEPPMYEDGEQPPTHSAEVYRHIATITLDAAGIPQHPAGALIALVKLRCESGKTITVPEQAFPAINTKTGQFLSKTSTSSEKKPFIKLKAFDDKGNAIPVYAEISWKDNGKAALILQVVVEEFVKADPEEVWVDESGQPIPYPPGTVLDYPVAVEQVTLEGYTTTAGYSSAEDIKKHAPVEGLFPLYRKPPNAQKVVITGQQQTVDKRFTTDYPQRTLYVPQTRLKAKSESPYDTPIAVQVAKQSENYASLGTMALTTIANPTYQTADLSTLANVTSTLRAEELEVQPVAPTQLAEAFPSPENQPHWVNTLPYNSSQGANEPFNPDPNPITDKYFSDVYVDYHSSYYMGNDTSIYLDFKNYSSLPSEIVTLLEQGQAKVKLKGHWFTAPEQEAELVVPYYKTSNGLLSYWYLTSTKSDRFIPTSIQMNVQLNGVEHLIYEGEGENQKFYHASIPDRLNLPHHSLYGFTTTNPEIKTTHLEAYRNSNKSFIANLPILPPYGDGYAHNWLEIPVEVKLPESYFVARGNTQSINPIVHDYSSDLIVKYKNQIGYDAGTGDPMQCRISVNLDNMDSLPSHIKNDILDVLVTGKYEGDAEITQLKLEVGTNNSAYGLIIYNFNEKLFYIDNINITWKNKTTGIKSLIYEGTGDSQQYQEIIYPGTHYTFYHFRTTSPPEQVVSVQAIGQDGEVKATLPLIPPIEGSSHYYIKAPASINPKECEYQPVGPALVQNHPILQTKITLLGHKKEHVNFANSYWQVQAKISSTMYWTRYDKKWNDFWNGKKYRWEGRNRVQINFPHSQDLAGGPLKFTINYTLDSKNGGQPASHTFTDVVDDINSFRGFDLYSPYTSSENAPAKLKSIDRIKIARIVDGKEVVVYDSGPNDIQYLLYLTPLTRENGKEIKKLEFRYRAKNDGTVDLWQTITPIIAGNAAYIDSNTIPIGNYEGEIRAYEDEEQTIIADLNDVCDNQMGPDGWVKVEFEVNRHVGVVVPEADLTKNIVQPIETFKPDRWGNVVARTGVRGDTFTYKHNRDNQVVLEEAPEITTVLPEDHLETPPPSITSSADDKDATKDKLQTDKEYVAQPIQVLGIIEPKLEVTFTHPQLIEEGPYKNTDNQNTAHLKVKLKLEGARDLSFDQYQLKILWQTAEGKERDHTFTWMPKEKDNRAHQEKFKCTITEEGYEETAQVPLQVIQDMQEALSFDIPSGGVVWHLHGLNKGAWHNIIEYAPPVSYKRQEQPANQAEPVIHPTHTTTPKRVVLFTADKFQKIEQVEYKKPNGRTGRATAQRTRKKSGFYRAYLPTHTDAESSLVGLVDRKNIKVVPEKLLKKTKPTTHTYHDANGHELAKQKPGQTMWPIVHDGNGQPLIRHAPTSPGYEPTGYIQQFKEPNAFGETHRSENAAGHITTIERNQGGHVTSITYPDAQKETHLRNAQGGLLKRTDPLGHSTLSQPAGLDGRNLVDRDADGVIVTYQYHGQTGKLIKTTYADGTFNEILRDFWGTEIGGKDRAGVPYSVEHDKTQQPTSRVSTVTADHNHGKDETGVLIPGESIKYGYFTDGRLFQMLDTVRNVLIEMYPEIGGEVARRRVFTEHNITQDLISTYNLLGWVEKQSDTDFAIVMYYDADGNKRELIIDNRNPETGEILHDEQVFTYQTDNTVITARASRNTDGKLEWNTTTNGTSVAEVINGQKASLTFFRRYAGKAGQYVKETYDYSPRGLLAEVQRSDNTSVRYDQDEAGRATGEVSKDYHGNDSYIRQETTKNTLSPAGRLLHTEQHSVRVIENKPPIEPPGGEFPKDDRTTFIKQNMGDSYAPDGTLKHLEIDSYDRSHVTSDVRTTHQLFDQPQESVMTHVQTIHGMGTTTATGTTYRGTTGELLKYVTSPSPHGRKEFVATFAKDIHTVKEYGDDTDEATRVVYSFKDAKGHEVARFERDKNRRDWPSQGMWTFDMSSHSSLVAPIQNRPLMQTMQEGATLTELANGNQELLWLLEEANPSWGASTPLPAGTQIVIPGAKDRRFNAANHGWDPDLASMIGGSLPEAPLPYIPHPDREGGMKQYFPMMVGVAVSIAITALVPAGGVTAGMQLLTMMGRGALAYAASNAASQLAAKQMGLLAGGFNLGDVVKSGAMGAVMVGAQAGTTDIGLTVLGIDSAIDPTMWQQAFLSMTQQATAQMVQAAFNQNFDARSVISNILASGVTETMLSQVGFNQTDYEGALNKAVGYTMDSLGAGFMQTALASAISGQPMDPAAVAANSLAQIATKLGVEAVKAVNAASQPETLMNTKGLSKEDYFQMTEDQAMAAHLQGHRVVAPDQALSKKTDENGYNKSREEAIPAPSASKKLTPKKQKELQKQKADSKHKAEFEKGTAFEKPLKSKIAPHPNERYEEEEEEEEWVPMHRRGTVRIVRNGKTGGRSAWESELRAEDFIIGSAPKAATSTDNPNFSQAPQFEEPVDYSQYLEYSLTLGEGFAKYHDSPQWNKAGKALGAGTAIGSLAEAKDHYAAGQTFEGNRSVFSFTAAMAGGASAAHKFPKPLKGLAFGLGAIFSGIGAEKLYESIVPPPLEKVYGLYPYNYSTEPRYEYTKSYIAPMPAIKPPPLPPEPQRHWNSLLDYKRSLN